MAKDEATKLITKIINEYEKFQGMLWTQGDSIIVTIPNNLVKYAGFKPGQEVVVMIKKKGDVNEVKNKEE